MSDYLKHRQALKLGLKQPDKKDKKPIKKVADKRQALQKDYRKLVNEMLAENKFCELKSPVCTGTAQGLDHLQKRTEKNLMDKANLKRSCNACNQFKEDNPEWAIENGFHISRFKKE